MTTQVLEQIRQRRTGGESMKSLAGEVGLTWQRLWGMLYAPTQGCPAAAYFPTIQASTKDGPLTERYRPTSLDALWGQEAVVKVLRKFLEKPHPAAFIFEGETGTGKTSAALALAAGLGCRVDQAEYGGVWQIASGEQTADAVREMSQRMWITPLMGSGWKVIIVNECDRMARPAEMIWLDVLENLPRRTVVVFTTNDSANLSQRFRDRCSRLSFESDATTLRASAIAFAAAVWKAETGRKPKPGQTEQIVADAESGEQISFRRVVQELATALAKEAS
jgi:replication-associated recombination protein RarA